LCDGNWVLVSLRVTGHLRPSTLRGSPVGRIADSMDCNSSTNRVLRYHRREWSKIMDYMEVTQDRVVGMSRMPQALCTTLRSTHYCDYECMVNIWVDFFLT
jgi:hypothetical protein